jgi:hypothetical protein
MNTSGVQSLGNIITGLQYSLGFSKDKHFYLTQLCLDACREIHMFHTEKHKIVKVNVNTDTNTVDWPDDYLGLVRLAVPIGGRLWPLTREDEMVPTTTLVNGQETLDKTAGEGVLMDQGQSFGYATHGGKNKYYYTYDEDNRRFIINGVNPRNVVLAYTSSGIEDENTLIPIRFKNPIHYYATWRLYLRDDSGDLKKADYFKDLYEQEIAKLKAYESPTLDEIYDALLSGYSGSYQR